MDREITRKIKMKEHVISLEQERADDAGKKGWGRIEKSHKFYNYYEVNVSKTVQSLVLFQSQTVIILLVQKIFWLLTWFHGHGYYVNVR